MKHMRDGSEKRTPDSKNIFHRWRCLISFEYVGGDESVFGTHGVGSVAESVNIVVQRTRTKIKEGGKKVVKSVT